MSEFATMSKFGAPREKSLQAVRSSFNSPNKSSKKLSALPPISSLQNLKGNSLPAGSLPSDILSIKFGEAQPIEGLITLTPPSSPVENLQNNISLLFTDQSKKKEQQKRTKRKKVSSADKTKSLCNVSSLVDEHFRNCGVDQFSMSKGENASELQKIFQVFFF